MLLYLTHDISDPTTRKRAEMLVAGGSPVRIAGFSRLDPPLMLAGCPVTCFGRTSNGRFTQRAFAVLKTVIRLKRHKELFDGVETILARNLEMLAIAVRARHAIRPTRIIYEVLDIHRLMLSYSSTGALLRRLEGYLSRRATGLIVSSPAFLSEYFDRRSKVTLPFLMVENKVFGIPAPAVPVIRPSTLPWRIGWFGALRCQKSFVILCNVARANPGLVEIVIRGRPSYDQLPHFDAIVATSPGVTYLGPYNNPGDLAAIYGDVHFSWAIDMFEEGLNSSWLLPNRLYEGGLYGAVPLAAAGVETSRFIAALGIGHILEEPKAESLTQFLKNLTAENYERMAAAANAVPTSTWLYTTADCHALLQDFKPGVDTSNTPTVAGGNITLPSDLPPVLVIVPCLNEADHIETIINRLVAESAHLAMKIVIVDGGSTDGTDEIIRRYAQAYSQVKYLHNGKRIQSAAVNLAVVRYAQDSQFLIRIDAHADFPSTYCRQLVKEALTTKADSVVVSMRTTGKGGFQDAIAAAQNSKLGNGGSSHRSTARKGKWVDHGHHALMRMAAFCAVDGYDETFTHNEDAELDIRLRQAGYRIWLTAKTTHLYYPRANPFALFRQYRNYGMGRIRNLLKHRSRPRIRQLLPIFVLPAYVLLLLTPVTKFAAVPIVIWALICLAYGLYLALLTLKPRLLLAGPAAMIMHTGWSLGFWQGLFTYGRKQQ